MSSLPSAAPVNDEQLALDELMREASKNGEREFRRAMECPARTKGRCLLLNMDLGWDHGLPLDKCDRCWAAGGADSAAAAELRREWAVEAVAHFSKPENASKLGRDVLLPLTVLHLTPEQVEELNKKIDLSFQMRRTGFWSMVRHTWKDADDFISALKSRGTDNRKVSLPILQERQRSCFGRADGEPMSSDPCPSLTGSPDRGWWCGACGCGETGLARLDDPTGEGYPKLAYPILSCPRRRRGFSNAE